MPKMQQTEGNVEAHVEDSHNTSFSVVDDIHEFNEAEGYIVSKAAQDKEEQSALKLARDNTTILLPQPSDDPNDPLNWSSFRKHCMLIVVAATAFLPESSSVTGAVDVFSQAKSVPQNPTSFYKVLT